MRRSVALPLLILAAALIPRVGWVLVSTTREEPAEPYPDEILHIELAQNLLQDGTLVTEDGRYAARMPLYPLFLVALTWIDPQHLLVARLGQACLGALTAMLAYLLARAALGWKAALLAGVLLIFDPYAVFFANLLLTEVVFTCLAVAFTYAAWNVAIRRQRAWQQIAAVAVLGPATILTRPSAAAWVPLVWVVLWLTDRWRWRATAQTAVYAAVALLLMLPWGLRNRAVIGHFAWLSSNGGVTLYDAQGPQADGSSNQSFLQQMPELRRLGEMERDEVLRRRALEQMQEDPLRVVRLSFIKFARMWNPIPNVAEHRTVKTAAVSALYTIGLLALAAAGLWRGWANTDIAWRRRVRLRRFQMLVWLPVLYFTLLHCVYIGSVRYRVPLMPFLALAGSAVLVARHAPLGAAGRVVHGR